MQEAIDDVSGTAWNMALMQNAGRYPSEQMMREFAQLTPPWYSVTIKDEYGTSRYDIRPYWDKEQAQNVAYALQEAYQKAGYDVSFCVRLRDMDVTNRV